jgi:hypothetical protein
MPMVTGSALRRSPGNEPTRLNGTRIELMDGVEGNGGFRARDATGYRVKVSFLDDFSAFSEM